MLARVKHVVIVAVAAAGTTWAGATPGYARDPGLDIASGILSAISSGLGGGMPTNPGFVPGNSGFVPGNSGFFPGSVVPPNPVIYDSGFQPGTVEFDQFGRPIFNTNQTIVNDSATDPNRGVVDPGSYQTSSSYTTDSAGNEIEVVTTSWTSYGVPHSETFRRYLSPSSNGNGFLQFNQLNQREVKSTARPSTVRPSTGGIRTPSRVTPRYVSPYRQR